MQEDQVEGVVKRLLTLTGALDRPRGRVDPQIRASEIAGEISVVIGAVQHSRPRAPGIEVAGEL